MPVLIVTKTTNYELHGAVIEAKVQQGRVPMDALERLRKAHSEHYRTLAQLKDALAAARIVYEETSRETSRPWPQSGTPVITVGGDGTLLAASHHIGADGLIFGIRSSVSSVGFLCCAGQDDVQKLVESLVKHTYETETVHRVCADVWRMDTGQTTRTEPVLNDFLYCNANPAATTRYKVTFNGEAETQRSSGIWVATGAGSTAAILAAGGERRPLTDTLQQWRVRELYRLGHLEPKLDGGMFDADHEPLEIENRCPHAILALDGQHGGLDLAYGDRVRFRRAPPIQLVKKLA